MINITLEELNERGITKSQLAELQQLIHPENSDLYDVLAYVAFHSIVVERVSRAENAKIHLNNYNANQQDFINFVLKQYIESGVEELDDAKLKPLLELKYNALDDAKRKLGDIASIRNTFIGFQEYLYEKRVAV
jgi:type I restriction enzyme R subunit